MSSYANSGRRAMDAATFLKGKASPLAEGESQSEVGASTGSSPAVIQEPVAMSGGSVATPAPSASGASEPVSEQSPPLIFKDTTPSGIVVEYESKPKRLYRVNGVEQPSVTKILECLSKPGLSWWGMQQGVSGVLELFQRNIMSTRLDWSTGNQFAVLNATDTVAHDDPCNHATATTENIIKALTSQHLTVNHQLTKAGDRGTNVHAALESWARSGGEFAPTPQNFNDEERPYVEAFLSWLDACDGAARPVQCEVMVGSAEHGFAGRYDLVIELTEPREFVFRALKTPKTVVVQPGRFLVDLKSSSGVYPTSHYRQLAAYELASIEGGYPKTDGQFVLHVSKHGTYQFVQSTATADDFLAVLRTWQSDRRLTGK